MNINNEYERKLQKWTNTDVGISIWYGIWDNSEMGRFLEICFQNLFANLYMHRWLCVLHTGINILDGQFDFPPSTRSRKWTKITKMNEYGCWYIYLIWDMRQFRNGSISRNLLSEFVCKFVYAQMTMCITYWYKYFGRSVWFSAQHPLAKMNENYENERIRVFMYIYWKWYVSIYGLYSWGYYSNPPL